MVPFYDKVRGYILRGTRAAQPAVASVLIGSIYFVTDEGIIERSNGTIWESYSSSGGSVPGADRQVVFNNAGVLGADSGLIYNSNSILLTAPGVAQVGVETIVDPTSKYGYGDVGFYLRNNAAPTPELLYYSFGAEGTYDDAGVLTDQRFYIYDEAAGQFRLGIEADGSIFIDGEVSVDNNLIVSGLLDLSAVTAGQIKFPATANPSSDANVFDDYERGSWTCIIGGTTSQSGQTYTRNTGRYVKTGRFCWVQVYATLSVIGTITGNILIRGLPFVASNLSDLPYSGSPIAYWDTFAQTWYSLGGLIIPNTTTATIYGMNSPAGNNSQPLPPAALNANASLIFGWGYITEN